MDDISLDDDQGDTEGSFKPQKDPIEDFMPANMPIDPDAPKVPITSNVIDPKNQDPSEPLETAPKSSHNVTQKSFYDPDKVFENPENKDPLLKNQDPIKLPGSRQFPRINSSSKTSSIRPPIPQPPKQPESLKEFYPHLNPDNKTPTERAKDDAIENMLKSTNPQAFLNNNPPKRNQSPPDSIFSQAPQFSQPGRNRSEKSNPLRNAGDNMLRNGSSRTPIKPKIPTSQINSQLPTNKRKRYRRKPRTDYILNKVPTFNVGDN